ncbi:CBM35 domain-containing protein [Streptomyces beijiangensis]|uniref:Carbohydrate-binding protein n=1 Tax=Streptomyces beijiangensis TaxID=163361 RepID=A0A939F560_9ACTN|nr:CBM35 domain-containing protein [Streptomyces beijiangensis]MBO0511679.1 carbohydrate-binding protein [Streptomyces beijiangensis]
MSTPEDDDPFGYLYEDGRAAGAVPPPGGGGYGYPGPSAGGQQQPGVPRTSYNQVRTVGERQYGQQPQQQYGQQPQQYTQPTAQYAAPETYGGGAPPQQPQYRDDDGGRGRGPNHKGILIGAVAVVAVVVIGITVALMNGNGDTKKGQAGGDSTSSAGAGQSVKPSDPASQSAAADLPKQDAATLQLGGAATTGKDIQGAQGAGGTYAVIAQPGDSATWTVNVPTAGKYTMFTRFGLATKDGAKTTLTVNGTARPASINMDNYSKSDDPSKTWGTTYSWFDLKAGSNTIKVSCEAGDKCGVNLDQVTLKAGNVKG